MKFINDKIASYIDEYYLPYNCELMKLREEAEAEQVPVITRDTEMLLSNILRIKNPRRILEIGTAVGYSAICFAAVLPKTEIISLEVREEMYRKASENIKKIGFDDRIQIRLGDGAESLKKLKEEVADLEQQGFDMVFIDAAKSHYREFWDRSIPLCKNGAVIISDNILLKGRTASNEFVTNRRQMTSVRQMREYIRYITETELADTSVMPVGDGVAFSVLRG